MKYKIVIPVVVVLAAVLLFQWFRTGDELDRLEQQADQLERELAMIDRYHGKLSASGKLASADEMEKEVLQNKLPSEPEEEIFIREFVDQCRKHNIKITFLHSLEQKKNFYRQDVLVFGYYGEQPAESLLRDISRNMERLFHGKIVDHAKLIVITIYSTAFDRAMEPIQSCRPARRQNTWKFSPFGALVRKQLRDIDAKCRKRNSGHDVIEHIRHREHLLSRLEKRRNIVEALEREPAWDNSINSGKVTRSLCPAGDCESADEYLRQGELLEGQGEFLEAAQMYGQFVAAELNSSEPREIELSKVFNHAGEIYLSLGRFDKAVEYYQQVLEIDKKIAGDFGSGSSDGRVIEFRGVSESLSAIGSVYEAWGKYDHALKYYQQAQERLGEETQDESELMRGRRAYQRAFICRIYSLQGLDDAALKCYKEAYEVSDETALAMTGSSMKGDMLGRSETSIFFSSVRSSFAGEFDESMELLKHMLLDQLEGGARRGEAAVVLNEIGRLYSSKGRFDKAIDHYQQALASRKQLGLKPGTASSLHNIGALYYSWGRYNKAIEYLLQSIQLKEEIRRTATGDIRRDYLSSQIRTYQALASAYLKINNPAGVMDAVEQSRARLLAERIAGIESKLDLPTLDEVQQGLSADEAILLYSNIDHDNFILMVITAKEIAMEEFSKESFLAKSRKQYKKPILILLEKQRGLIHIESKKEELAFEMKKQQEDFETAVHYYRTLLTNPENQEDARRYGRLLYALLIEPAREKLAEITKITILPDGILGFLPFETLLDENNNYLVHDYDLRYTQSLTIDKLLKGRDYTNRNNRKPLLAMGGAVYDELHYESGTVGNSKQLVWLQQETDRSIEEKRSARSAYAQLGRASWSNLPGTLEEVKELSSIIRDGEILTGEKVTENMIKAHSKSGKLAEFKVLHFATHGLVVPELPELSAIVLSQFREERDGEDGYLRMGEIAKLNLAADFVNLSACETGLGKIYSGEGIVGLTQSFLIAGANGLSVSLWQVADASTAKFMTELYDKVENSGMSYREALTAVKKEFINGDHGKQWSMPYFWSPFVYYGN